MPFIIGIIGVWFFGGFLWNALKILFIPIFILSWLGSCYDHVSGAGEIKSAMRDRLEAQRKLVSVGDPIGPIGQNWSFPAKAIVVIDNNSNGDVSEYQVSCRYTASGMTRTNYSQRTEDPWIQTFSLSANVVVRAHRRQVLKLTMPMTGYQPVNGSLKCETSFRLDLDTIDNAPAANAAVAHPTSDSSEIAQASYPMSLDALRLPRPTKRGWDTETHW